MVYNHKAISLAKKVKQYTITTLMFLMLLIVIAGSSLFHVGSLKSSLPAMR